DSVDENLFMFILNCNPGVKAEEVEKKLLAILHSIKQGKISKRSLQRVKNNTRSDFIFSLNNASALSNICGSYLARGDLKPLLNYEKNIAALELEDLVEVATKYFIRENSTTLILRKENNG
ncbi:insulinase family protein, partial [Campylobacter lari]|nr:insulinase family protein [Campylobacter lari]